MSLSDTDINRLLNALVGPISEAVARKMVGVNGRVDDAAYLATLPVEEVKRIQREKLGLNRRGAKP